MVFSFSLNTHANSFDWFEWLSGPGKGDDPIIASSGPGKGDDPVIASSGPGKGDDPIIASSGIGKGDDPKN